MVGAVVGVQPFGGEGLSGTGRKQAVRSISTVCWRIARKVPGSDARASGCRVSGRCAVESALTQPLNALREWAANRPELQRYVRNMASWRRQEHNDCCQADG